MLRSAFLFFLAMLAFPELRAQGGMTDLDGSSSVGQPLRSTHEFFGEKFEITVFPPVDSLGQTQDSLAQVAMEAAVSRAMEIEKNVKRDLNLLREKAKTREAVVPGDDLWFILNFAMETRHGTLGTFEVTMGEVEKLWRSTAKERKKPARRKIKALRRAAGMNHLEINKEGSVRLLRAQLPIDIDGLSRGYTLDGMADVLYGLGCQGFFIQAGEMAIVGDLPEKAKEKWKYKRPIFADGVKKIKETSIWNSAVVTTCPNPLFKKYGDTFYDLVDPVTGNLIRHNSIVTVEAASAMHAYAWALSLTINYDQDFYQWVTEQDTRVWYSEP